SRWTRDLAASGPTPANRVFQCHELGRTEGPAVRQPHWVPEKVGYQARVIDHLSVGDLRDGLGVDLVIELGIGVGLAIGIRFPDRATRPGNGRALAEVIFR